MASTLVAMASNLAGDGLAPCIASERYYCSSFRGQLLRVFSAFLQVGGTRVFQK